MWHAFHTFQRLLDPGNGVNGPCKGEITETANFSCNLAGAEDSGAQVGRLSLCCKSRTHALGTQPHTVVHLHMYQGWMEHFEAISVEGQGRSLKVSVRDARTFDIRPATSYFARIAHTTQWESLAFPPSSSQWDWPNNECSLIPSR